MTHKLPSSPETRDTTPQIDPRSNRRDFIKGVLALITVASLPKEVRAEDDTPKGATKEERLASYNKRWRELWENGDAKALDRYERTYGGEFVAGECGSCTTPSPEKKPPPSADPVDPAAARRAALIKKLAGEK